MNVKTFLNFSTTVVKSKPSSIIVPSKTIPNSKQQKFFPKNHFSLAHND